VRFTRHAKNGARQLRLTIADAEKVVGEPIRMEMDEAGKPKYYGKVSGIAVCVVVALDDPDLIVTIYPRRK